MGILKSTDAMVEPDFERGLGKLKTVAEGDAQPKNGPDLPRVVTRPVGGSAVGPAGRLSPISHTSLRPHSAA